MGSFHWYEAGLEAAIWRGLISGLYFGAAITAVGVYLNHRAASWHPDFPGETVLLQSAASRKTRMSAAGGYLYLTDKRLYFLPRTGFWKSEVVELTIENISNATVGSNLQGTRLIVELTDGRRERLFVDEPSKWAEQIGQVRRDYIEAPRNENRRLFS